MIANPFATVVKDFEADRVAVVSALPLRKMDTASSRLEDALLKASGRGGSGNGRGSDHRGQQADKRREAGDLHFESGCFQGEADKFGCLNR